jgi:hypothetical protein
MCKVIGLQQSKISICLSELILSIASTSFTQGSLRDKYPNQHGLLNREELLHPHLFHLSEGDLSLLRLSLMIAFRYNRALNIVPFVNIILLEYSLRLLTVSSDPATLVRKGARYHLLPICLIVVTRQARELA